MTEFPFRRAQLIAPSGPGSIQTSADGITGMVCGIDHWIDAIGPNLDWSEFRINDEWRLSEALGVEFFVRPPDFREPFGFFGSHDEKNLRISLPAVRFPRWHFCPRCFDLTEQAPHRGGAIKCDQCTQKEVNGRAYSPILIQVAFIAMCESGHVEDFPFREWVHHDLAPSCRERMKVSFSGATLESQSVSCDCGATRNFGRIFSGAVDAGDATTYLSRNLSRSGDYLCRGRSPWLDDFTGVSGCGNQLIGGLTGAVNVYYPYVESALFLPNVVDGIDAVLAEALQHNQIQVLVRSLRNTTSPEELSTLLLALHGDILTGFSADEIARALSNLVSTPSATAEDDEGDEGQSRIKRPEYEVLKSGLSTDPSMLKLRPLKVSDFQSLEISTGFSSVCLVERLRETRALTGFGRIRPNPHVPLAEKKSRLRRQTYSGPNWLPAYEVYGEGIFLDVDEERVLQWSCRPQVLTRIDIIRKSQYFSRDFPNSTDPTFVARLMLLHTLSHVLINQLIFDCGYTAASLRERLYCADHVDGRSTMNAILIYTASGDSEGSMGGLVRMGRPNRLDEVLESALDGARFCSSDPICMEVGAHGQGPNSMNLAACHSCGLVPETSCELFNQYLDRALLVGVDPGDGIGFFDNLL